MYIYQVFAISTSLVFERQLKRQLTLQTYDYPEETTSTLDM